MSDNHRKTILLLEEKLDEANQEWRLCNDKAGKLIQHAKSAEEKRDKIAEVIKYLKDSIIVLKALDKPVAKKKAKPKKEV